SDQFFANFEQLRIGIGIMRKRARRIIACVQKIIRWLCARFAARDEFRAVRGSESHNILVAFFVAVEEALRLERLRVEAVEERAVAFGRSALSRKKNVFALLDHS